MVETDCVPNLMQGHVKQVHTTIADDLASGHMPSFAGVKFDRCGGELGPGVEVVRLSQNIIEAVDCSQAEVDLRGNCRCHLLELNVGVVRPIGKRRANDG